MPGCLVCLIGLPASGKTTLAKGLVERFSGNYDVFHVEYDSEIDWGNIDNWKGERTKVLNCVVNMIENATDCSRPFVIVLDDNMYYRSMRYKFYQVCRSYGLGYCQIFFQAILDQVLLVNKNRENPVGESVIQKMFYKIEIPRETWEVNSLEIQAYNVPEWRRVEQLIQNACSNPVKPVVESMGGQHIQSKMHKLDINLRKAVNFAIADFKSSKTSAGNVKQFSMELSLKKKDILERVRNGDLELPEMENSKDILECTLKLLLS